MTVDAAIREEILAEAEKYNQNHDERGQFASGEGGVHDSPVGQSKVFVRVHVENKDIIPADDPRLAEADAREGGLGPAVIAEAKSLGYKAIFMSGSDTRSWSAKDWLVVLDPKIVEVNKVIEEGKNTKTLPQKVTAIWWEDYLALPVSQKTLGDFLNDQQLWEEMGEQAKVTMLPIFRALLQAGAEAGLEGITPEGQKAAIPLVDTVLLRKMVQAAAVAFSTQWWQALEASTKDKLALILSTNAGQDFVMEELIADVAAVFGEKRAEAIATTETTRLFTQGALLAYQSSDVRDVVWRSCNDPWVCDECNDYEGQIYEIGSQPEQPAHPRCRCWLAPSIQGELQAQDKKIIGQKYNQSHDEHGRFASGEGGGGALTGQRAELNSQLDQLAAFRRSPDGYKYGSVEDLVQKEGRMYSNTPFTAEEKLKVEEAAKLVGTCHAKECYLNSLHGATSGVGLKYAEGFGLARGIPFPVEHAWLVVGDKPVDFTWGGKLSGKDVGPAGLVARAENNLAESVYKGIEIPTDQLMEHVIASGTTGPFLYTYLEDGMSGRGKKLLEGQKYNENHDEHGRFASGGGSQGQVSIATDKLLTAAQAAEGDVTRDVVGTALLNGGRPEGLEFRVKGRDSLERKIASESRLRGISPDEEANRIGDSLRYTAIFQPEGYHAGVENTINGLQEKGYTLTDARNYWGSAEYKGINTNFTSPQGQRLELQFHTEKSWDVKQNVTHPLYEKMRVEKGPEARASLVDKMTGAWRSVAAPAGALAVAVPLMVMIKTRERLRGFRALFRSN